jgi:MFS family permease
MEAVVPEAGRREESERYAWYVVAVLLLANISGFVDRQILSLLIKPIQRDLGLSLTEVAYLIGLPFAVFFTLMGIPLARVADSGNRRNVIAAGIALWSVMTALCGLAGSFARLLLARFGVGIGEAALQAPATSLIADYFPREKRAGAMGVYSMGIFLGSGLAYILGGWIVGLVSAQEMWTWPIVGEIRPWQTVFIIIGLPGLLIALLMALTVREPARRDHTTGTVPLSSLFKYVAANRRTFICQSLGYTLSATVNWGIAAWLAFFLIESHGWTVARAGLVQGALTMTIGAFGAVAGGRVADAWVKRGHVDGPLRVGIIGAIGMLVSATAYPFASTAAMAVAWLALVNFFAAFPWGAAYAAAAEVVPPAMRAQGVALFIAQLNLISVPLGPIAVAAITDRVFGSDSAIRYSLAIVNVVCMAGAIALLLAALPAYRRTLAQRDSWSA